MSGYWSHWLILGSCRRAGGIQVAYPATTTQIAHSHSAGKTRNDILRWNVLRWRRRWFGRGGTWFRDGTHFGLV
jgi:hypothetical protein